MNDSWDTHFGTHVYLTKRDSPWYSTIEEMDDEPVKKKDTVPPLKVPVQIVVDNQRRDLATIIILALIIAGIIRYFIFI